MSTPWTEGGLIEMRSGAGPRTTLWKRQDNASEPLASLLLDNSPHADELGLYVHVPFCAKRCGYCSFNTAPLEDGAMTRYLGAVRREIELLGALPWASRIRLGTIFFGGGAPSLLEAAEPSARLGGRRARVRV